MYQFYLVRVIGIFESYLGAIGHLYESLNSEIPRGYTYVFVLRAVYLGLYKIFSNESLQTVFGCNYKFLFYRCFYRLDGQGSDGERSDYY